jgi:hypothetical protein
MKKMLKKITTGTTALACGMALAGAQTTPSSSCVNYTTYNVCLASGSVLSGGGAPIPPCSVASSVVADGTAYAPGVTTGSRGGASTTGPASITTTIPTSITVATPFFTSNGGSGCNVRYGSGEAVITCSGTAAGDFCPDDDSSGG